MKYAILLLIAAFVSGCALEPETEITLYQNGQLYTGSGFEKKSFFVQNGIISLDNSLKASQIVDLNEKFIIPPFGDAHTHNFDELSVFDSIYKAYINEGVFYVKVLNNHHSTYLKLKDSLNNPGKIDVAFAHGGLTSTGGHPHNLYESQALNYSWRAMFDPVKRKEIKASLTQHTDAYYTLDSLSQVETYWDSILSKKPDFLKVYVLNTTERLEKIEKGEIGTYGISEEVLLAVVKKANASGISITAHVENLDDFKLALKCGIRHYAHMPGYGGGIGFTDLEKMKLSDSLLGEVKKLNLTITPTVSFTKYYSQAWDGTKMALDSALYRSKQAFLKEQIRNLYDHHVIITLGADQHNVTLRQEIEAVIALEVFSPAELLDILTQTPSSIFPDRKIGRLDQGYEASFLVLSQNPLEQIEAIFEIDRRVKNGIELLP